MSEAAAVAQDAALSSDARTEKHMRNEKKVFTGYSPDSGRLKNVLRLPLRPREVILYKQYGIGRACLPAKNE
eukprot:scaffold138898_cov19-Tisochrysis_lutea.AAC.2